MLTPQEVMEHGFTKARRGGYNMQMVDEFLDQLTADYTTLYKENALLKSKLKVLADKIEEYRATDEAMRRALLAAQQVADEMVEKAQKKCDELTSNAEREAHGRIEELRREVADEEYRLQAAKHATAELVTELRARYARELAFLDTLPGMEPVRQREAEFVAAAVADIEANIRRTVQADEAAEQPADAAAESAPAEEDDGSTKELPELSQHTPVPAAEMETRRIILPPEDTGDLPRSIDLDNLRFGKDYELE